MCVLALTAGSHVTDFRSSSSALIITRPVNRMKWPPHVHRVTQERNVLKRLKNYHLKEMAPISARLFPCYILTFSLLCPRRLRIACRVQVSLPGSFGRMCCPMEHALWSSVEWLSSHPSSSPSFSQKQASSALNRIKCILRPSLRVRSFYLHFFV